MNEQTTNKTNENEVYLAQELTLAQSDGGLPTMVAAGGAPGESGVSVISARFNGSMHLSGTPWRHHICFQMTRRRRFECRIADEALSHAPPVGGLAICPAGIDCVADSDGSIDAILVSIDPGRFALAAAEDSALEAKLTGRLSGYDQALLDCAHTLVSESTGGYPNGPLFWNEVASRCIDGLLARHSSQVETRTRGMLGNAVLKRLKDYVVAHINEPIEVAALAKMAGRSPFHFTRVFARSVGMTPHRYIVHLRLQRAIELVREGRSSLAEIAAGTGFADQSHLSRWVRRVHGVSLSRLPPFDQGSKQQESSRSAALSSLDGGRPGAD
jgi:AraC family transcriptional regulator